jgi:hypothetical protein
VARMPPADAVTSAALRVWYVVMSAHFAVWRDGDACDDALGDDALDSVAHDFLSVLITGRSDILGIEPTGRLE